MLDLTILLFELLHCSIAQVLRWRVVDTKVQLVVFLELVVVIACLQKPQNSHPKSTKTAEGLSDTNGKPASDVQEIGLTLLWLSGQKQKN